MHVAIAIVFSYVKDSVACVLACKHVYSPTVSHMAIYKYLGVN